MAPTSSKKGIWIENKHHDKKSHLHKKSNTLQLHCGCPDANLGHLVCVRSDGGRDAEQHFDVLPHLLWDLVQHCWIHGAQLQLDNTNTRAGRLESPTKPVISFDLLQDFGFSRGD